MRPRKIRLRVVRVARLISGHSHALNKIPRAWGACESVPRGLGRPSARRYDTKARIAVITDLIRQELTAYDELDFDVVLKAPLLGG